MIHRLEIDGVQLEFGQKPVLSDIYMSCTTGNVTGLLGRNGEGKSCLMKIAFGSMDAYSKSVRLDGKFIKQPYRIKGLINYLPQFHFIPANVSIRKALRYYDCSEEDFINAFPEYKEDIPKTIDELSGGQRRMIEAYVILMQKTMFTIMDEPFSHIMPLHVEMMKGLINNQKQAKGILITDHMHRHILDIADNKYLLRNGKTHHFTDNKTLQHLGYLSSLP